MSLPTGMPKSAHQKNKEAANGTPKPAPAVKGKKSKTLTPSEQIADHIEQLASDHADALEAQGLTAESYGSDDNTGKPDETNPHFADETFAVDPDAFMSNDTTNAPELTYVDDGSQANPAIDAVDAEFQPAAPVKKGKKTARIEADMKRLDDQMAAGAKLAKAKQAAKKAKAADEPKKIDARSKGTVEKDAKNAAAPSTALATLSNVATEIATNENFTITALGLRIVGDPTFEQWAAQRNAMGLFKRGFDWADFDSLVYGEQHFGETYAQWIAASGVAEQTLYNRMSTLKRYTVDQRVFGVSISAHMEAAKLDPTVRHMVLMEMQAGVDANGKPMTSVEDLRARIKGIKDSATTPDDGKGGGKDSDGDKEESAAEWENEPAGEWLYEHAGDGMLEAVLDDNGELPAALRKLIKSHALDKGTIKIAIYLQRK